jgi:hypothetical protein
MGAPLISLPNSMVDCGFAFTLSEVWLGSAQV